MRCHFCHNQETKVMDSRAQEENKVIRRRRACEKCGKRFTTFERIDSIPVSVIKRDGTREIFNKNKLMGGIINACNKRPVTSEQVNELVNDIENNLFIDGIKEINSQEIGNMVLEKLKDLDEVGYVRFASVYRKFDDVSSFITELEIMAKNKKKPE